MDVDKGRKKEEVYSKKVRAGKRTYFFDVKATQGNDYYITITESRKKARENGEGYYRKKYKIFLYKEDFIKFMNALDDCVSYVTEELMPHVDFEQYAFEDDLDEEEEDE
ncbi:MAG: PUR family DNA/RNA-binding protein [Cytophagales bacterium]|nr:PUR family DNA/RNA-binding protein [Cytophagales bacterium]MDW8383782.1 DUF3276 family protein [Flammeovirgaceae bacterium]